MKYSKHPVVLFANPPKEDENAVTAAHRTAIALVRSTLGRGRRLLVMGDPGTLLQVALVAVEYRLPAEVELGEAAPAPLVLLPVLRRETAEDGLFSPFENETDERPRVANLLELLFAMRIVDPSIYQEERELSPEAFTRIFNQWRPDTVIAVGIRNGIESALESAVAYREENRNVQLFYSVATSQDGYWEEADWQTLESLLTPAERDVPPTLDGKPIEDEALLVLAKRAANEAALALATERAAGESLPPEIPRQQ